MTGAWLVVPLLLGAYIVAIVEEWATMGRVRPAAPLRAGLALLGRESLVPRQPDRLLFETAPALLLVAAVLAASVLPLAPGSIMADLDTGALFVNAALAYVLVALVMAGWAPDGVYAMVAGWRFLGQLVAYSMLIVMPLTAVAMRAQSLVTTAIVTSQAALWNIVAQPLGFVLFCLAALAVCFLPPFDLPTAPGELAGGVLGEYTGDRLAVAPGAARPGGHAGDDDHGLLPGRLARLRPLAPAMGLGERQDLARGDAHARRRALRPAHPRRAPALLELENGHPARARQHILGRDYPLDRPVRHHDGGHIEPHREG